MATIRGTLNRQDFPAGRQGESLVIDPNTPHGIAWRQRATQSYADGVVLDRAYMCATKTLSGGSETGLSGGTEHWSAVLPSWNLREAENWEESSGEFEYTGTFPTSGKRVFCVTYDFQIYGGSTVPFWKMLGRITKDSGSGHALVPGSEASSDWYGYLAFIVYHQIHVVSSSSIVVVESGDKISFQFGHYANALFSISALATHLLHGISLTITPADVVT